MMSDEESAEIGSKSTEEDVTWFPNVEEDEEDLMELEDSDEDYSPLEENLKENKAVSVSSLPHTPTRQSKRKKGLKNSSASILMKELEIRLKRVPCLLNEESVNVTCDRCSTKFTSLSKLLNHLHPKFTNNISSINNNKNKPKHSILISLLNTNPQNASSSFGDCSKKRRQVHFEPDESQNLYGDDNFSDNAYNDAEHDDVPQFNIPKSSKSDTTSSKQQKRQKKAQGGIERPACPLCPLTFKTELGRVIHLRTVHRQKVKDPSIKIESNENDNDNINDEEPKVAEKPTQEQETKKKEGFIMIGRKQFKLVESTTYPSKKNKKEVVPKPPKIKKVPEPIVCEHCGKLNATPTLHRQHLVTHSEERPFICPQCNHAFKREMELKIHILRHEKTDRSHLCNICGKSFRFKVDLYIHMQTHGEKKYKCEEKGCSFATVNKDTLKDHIRGVHKNEHPFSCGICNATFKYRSYVGKHMFLHTGEKPKKCKVAGCDYASCTRRALTNHERTVHQGLPKLPPTDRRSKADRQRDEQMDQSSSFSHQNYQ